MTETTHAIICAVFCLIALPAAFLGASFVALYLARWAYRFMRREEP
jgi:hypothetical protein